MWAWHYRCGCGYRIFEDGTSESSCLGEHYPEVVERVTSPHMEFYRHWYRLLMEELAHCQAEGNRGTHPWRRSLKER